MANSTCSLVHQQPAVRLEALGLQKSAFDGRTDFTLPAIGGRSTSNADGSCRGTRLAIRKVEAQKFLHRAPERYRLPYEMSFQR